MEASYKCKIHGYLTPSNAWIFNNKVICSKCGIKGESVRYTGRGNEGFDKLLVLMGMDK